MSENQQVKAAAWFRVSTGHQDSDNQVPDVEAVRAATTATRSPRRYTVSESRVERTAAAPEYSKALQQALDDAHAGKFNVLDRVGA